MSVDPQSDLVLHVEGEKVAQHGLLLGRGQLGLARRNAPHRRDDDDAALVALHAANRPSPGMKGVNVRAEWSR